MSKATKNAAAVVESNGHANGALATMVFVMDKETPGTFRYSLPQVEGAPRAAVSGTLYLLKSSVKGTPPAEIEVTVRAN